MCLYHYADSIWYQSVSSQSLGSLDPSHAAVECTSLMAHQTRPVWSPAARDMNCWLGLKFSRECRIHPSWSPSKLPALSVSSFLGTKCLRGEVASRPIARRYLWSRLEVVRRRCLPWLMRGPRLLNRPLLFAVHWMQVCFRILHWV